VTNDFDVVAQAIHSLPRVNAPVGFAKSIVSELETCHVLEGLERIHAPPDFARLMAAEILSGAVLTKQLEWLPRIAAPEDFALQISGEIAQDAMLAGVARVGAPDSFAAKMSQAIADHALQSAIPAIPRVSAPDGFAQQLAASIALDAELSKPPVVTLESVLAGIPRVHAPASFAAKLANQFSSVAAKDALERENPDRTPLYFVFTLLTGAGLGLIGLSWNYASVTARAVIDLVQALPASLIVSAVVVSLLAAFASVSRRNVGALASTIAFGVCAALVLPQAAPFFGSSVISGFHNSSIVRFGGDITVSGTVNGDVVSIGGNVRLEPRASVTGKVMTFLGDVNLPADTRKVGGVSAVLGRFHSDAVQSIPAQSANLPGLSAASALQPFKNLLGSDNWHWVYLLIVAACSAALQLFNWEKQLERHFKLEAGRATGIGLLLVILTLPLATLGGLSLVGAPFAILISSFTIFALTTGMGLSCSMLGNSILKQLDLKLEPWVGSVLGLGLYALTLLVPVLAVSLWLLGGAWGAGTLILAWRQHELRIPNALKAVID
jgi:FtsH-binding integral membrane protein